MRGKKGHSKLYYILCIFLVFLVIYTVLAGYNYYNVGQVDYKLYVEVSEQSSADVLHELESTGAEKVYIFFGDNNLPFYFLGRGENLTRSVVINGVYNFPVRMKPSVFGKISPFVSFSEDYVDLSPGESKTLLVDVKIPADAQIGNYTGKLSLKAYR